MRLLLVVVVFSFCIEGLASVATGKQGLSRAERRLVRAIVKAKSAARVRALAKEVDTNFVFSDFPSPGFTGTPLIVAAILGTMGGNYELAKVLIEEGADPNFAHEGETVLHHMFLIRRFVLGINSNEIPLFVMTAHLNNRDRRMSMIKDLVEYGASLDIFNDNGETPFMYAVMGVGHYGVSTVKLMLELGANPSLKKKDQDGREYDVFEMTLPGAINNEVTRFYSPELRDLIITQGQNLLLQHRTAEQRQLDDQLLQAVSDDSPLADVKQLLERGAHPDRAIAEDRATVLHIAAKQGQLAKVNLLLEYRASAGIKDRDGNVPFDYGAQGETSDHWLIASILLEKMFNNLNAKDNKGWTVFNWALLSGDRQRVLQLLADGADPLQGKQDAFEVVEMLQDQRMLDLLLEHYDKHVDLFLRAARGGLVWVGQRLIDKGVDVNSVGIPGTALLKATIHEQLEFIQLLIANDVNLNHLDRRGNSAINYARNELHRRNLYGRQPVDRIKDILELLENN